MKNFPLSAIASTLLLSGLAMAEDYQSISNLGYQRAEVNDVSVNTSSVNTRYYLSGKSTLGPLDQIDYINTSSNVFAGYWHSSAAGFDRYLSSDSSSTKGDAYHIGGEYFLGKLLLGASYRHLDMEDDSDTTTLTMGYLLDKNFLVSAKYFDFEEGNEELLVSAAYTHYINGNDYLGVTLTSDDDFDYKSVSAKYFKKLSQDQYFVGEVLYRDGPHDDYWSAALDYYFSAKTSVSAKYDENENYRVGVKHFLNKNIALSAGYGANGEESDFDLYDVGVTLQF